MAKKRRVPEVLWKLFQRKAQTLAETILSLIPPPTSRCRCYATPHCLRCCSVDDRISLLIRENDPSDYRKLLEQCFVVISDNAPSPTPFDPHSRFPQIEIVRRTIEMMSSVPIKNVICTDYDKKNRSSIILEALTSDSWSLLLQRVGDVLMVYLLKYSSIFMPLSRKKHHQVAGIPINGLFWDLLKHTTVSKNQQPSLGVPEKYHEVDSVSMDIDIPESSSIEFSQTTQENRVPAVARSGKQSRSHANRRIRKRRKLSSQNMFKSNCSLHEEKMESPCSCCSFWQTLKKVPREVQFSKRSILYKLDSGMTVLPKTHIISSLRPNVSGANALFKEIFGLSDVCISAQPTVLCTHNNATCGTGTTCLYHSLLKMLKTLIRNAIHCPRVKLLNKHIFTRSLDQNAYEGGSSMVEVVSFIWAACRIIVPPELLGSPSNWRFLRENISKFIRLRIYEKFSLHQCMSELKISNFPFLSGNDSLCNMSIKENLSEKWIYWLFTSLIVPLLHANFYITESEHGKLEVFFYEKSVWEKLIKNSISCLKDQCYSLLQPNSVQKIVRKRGFGFSRVRFRPKANGIRPLANLKSSSRLQIGNTVKYFRAVNSVLRDLHAALKDVQLKSSETLGASVFSYNDVHRSLRKLLSGIKSGLNDLPVVYLVVADAQKAYDSIDQDKLLRVMKDVIIDDHPLHQKHQFIASNKCLQVSQFINLSKQFRSHVYSRSSHSIFVNQGRIRTARKDDLHFNLGQHVKYNVLHINSKFYLQNVGISQGSILSSLLCSFYFGHMENTKLIPFLNKVAETEMSEFSNRHDLLLRFTDDYLFISTSKKQAYEFFNRLKRGFSEYNCNMNEEKFGLSFDVDNFTPQSSRLYLDENGNKFLRWSGLFINCKTLEVQADYTRYLDCHLRSTLTVCGQGNPGRYFGEKLCDYLRPKCHAIFYDSKINSADVVRLNIYQAFLLCAMKFHCYVCHLSDICSFNSGSYMDYINNSVRFMYKLMKKLVYSLYADPSLQPILLVKKKEIEILGLTAYFEVLKRKQSRYKKLLSSLELKLKSFNVESVSPELNFATDKSNSSMLHERITSLCFSFGSTEKG